MVTEGSSATADPYTTSDPYALVVTTHGFVVDVEEFDGPRTFEGLHLVGCPREEIVARCPVFLYPQRLHTRVGQAYANHHSTLAGMVPVAATINWEWKRRVCVPTLYLRAPRDVDVEDWAATRQEYYASIANCT